MPTQRVAVAILIVVAGRYHRCCHRQNTMGEEKKCLLSGRVDVMVVVVSCCSGKVGGMPSSSSGIKKNNIYLLS